MTMPPTLGVLMLDTRFPRLPGDIGNPDSWPGEVLYHVVEGADVSRIVLSEDVDPALLAPFLEGARALAASGAGLLTTSCGFLSVFQDDLAAAVSIPVVSSSLLLAPLLARAYGPGRPLGIVTANSRALGPRHLAAAGIDSPVVIGGIETGAELPLALLRPRHDQAETLNFKRAQRDVLECCENMLLHEPAIPAFLFECTNLQPYAEAVTSATGRPVHGLLDALRLLGGGAVPQLRARESV